MLAYLSLYSLIVVVTCVSHTNVVFALMPPVPAGPREKRVGLVHAVTNALAIGVYAASWVARKQGRHRTGARLALAGAAVSGVGAYLGGHLAVARDVGSHHPAYDAATAAG